MKIKLLFFLHVAFLSPTLQAQSKLSDDFRFAWRLSKETVHKPFEHKNDTYLALGTLGVGTLLLFSQDGVLMDLTQQDKNPTANFIAHHIGEPFGSPYYQAVAFGSLYLGSKIARKQLLTERSIKFMTAATLTGTSVLVLKGIFGRARPYTGAAPDNFFAGYFEGDAYWSFPSMHSALTFSFASCISYMYPRKIWIPMIVYPLAGISAISRVYDEQHWPSDVFAGALIGHFIGKMVAQNKSQITFAVLPNAFGGNSLCTSISF